MNYLEIQNLHMDYENISIDFSATLEKGKTLAIVGHSGSGKSTILRMIAGLLPSGKNAKIHLDNKDITKLPPNKRDIGMVFQSPCLFEHLKIIDNATFALDCKGMSKKQRQEIGKDWLKRFGLDSMENRLPHTLSGGEAQRVSLVRTLIAEPKVVLFDEPFSALDAPLRKKLTADLSTWQKELGFTAILVTHDIEEAKKLGDKIIVMKAGKMIWEGKPEDFVEELL
ncbi:MAG: ABC transporter ATP-binding protein [Spirochaetaceae bacterium]|nr:ABC transporter ATP-binding protein [Spirochaetaceae bacterium]